MNQWCSSGLNLKAGDSLLSAVLQPGLSAPQIFQVQVGSTDVSEVILHIQSPYLFLATINTQKITGQWTVQVQGTLLHPWNAG